MTDQGVEYSMNLAIVKRRKKNIGIELFWDMDTPRMKEIIKMSDYMLEVMANYHINYIDNDDRIIGTEVNKADANATYPWVVNSRLERYISLSNNNKINMIRMYSVPLK